MSTTVPPEKAGRGRGATVVGAVVLTLVNLPAAFLTLVQLMPRGGSHEWDAAGEFALISGLALGWAALVLLLTAALVRLCGLRRWWYALPLGMGCALLVRQLLLPPYG